MGARLCSGGFRRRDASSTDDVCRSARHGGWLRPDATNVVGRGGEAGLAEVRVGENETFESALRRFNKKIQQSGILAEARRREHYEKPSVKRKRKEAKKRKATSRP